MKCNCHPNSDIQLKGMDNCKKSGYFDNMKPKEEHRLLNMSHSNIKIHQFDKDIGKNLLSLR